MKFGISQKLKFKSDLGTYSIVTEREYFDSQITATDYETDLLIKHFGLDKIHIGNVASNIVAAKKKFRKFPTGEDIFLNLVFPKPEKSELRLYLSSRAGFKPDPMSVWFMYLNDNDIWIGSMDESQWRNENSLLIYDNDEQNYQDSIEELDEIKTTTIKKHDIFVRDSKLARQRLITADFKCEFDKKHNLFISRHSKLPYLEAHHLLPMALQNTSTPIKIDTFDNIFCLCPNCHRAIHHSESTFAREIIDTLVEIRPSVLNILNIKKDDIYGYYALEDIISI